MANRTVAIVGGGISGTLVAMRLLGLVRPPQMMRVLVIEPYAADRRTTCESIASLIALRLNRTIGSSPTLCGAICLLAARSLPDPVASGFVRARTAS